LIVTITTAKVDGDGKGTGINAVITGTAVGGELLDASEAFGFTTGTDDLNLIAKGGEGEHLIAILRIKIALIGTITHVQQQGVGTIWSGTVVRLRWCTSLKFEAEQFVFRSFVEVITQFIED